MILAVDNDVGFLQRLENSLGQNEAVLFALNAEQAADLMVLTGEQISAAFIDLDMPEIDGFSLIRRFRERFPAVPIIAMSGVYQPDVLASAKALGATEALRKPITLEWNQALARARAAAA